MAKVKKPAAVFIILSALAFSALGATFAGATDMRNMAFSSISRTVVLGVVGAAVFDRTLQFTGASLASVPTSKRTLCKLSGPDLPHKFVEPLLICR